MPKYSSNNDLEAFVPPIMYPPLYERIEDYRKIPHCAGVYFVYNKRELEYIGYGSSLRARLTKRYNNRTLFILRFGDSKKAKSAESFFIRKFKPLKNKPICGFRIREINKNSYREIVTFHQDYR